LHAPHPTPRPPVRIWLLRDEDDRGPRRGGRRIRRHRSAIHHGRQQSRKSELVGFELVEEAGSRKRLRPRLVTRRPAMNDDLLGAIIVRAAPVLDMLMLAIDLGDVRFS
jgi:hypothetical protein